VVKKGVSKKPHTLDHLKESTKVVEVVKSKSSVFIDTRDVDVLEDGDLGDFADYGLGELGHKNSKSVNDGNGIVVVKQKQDKPEDEDERIRTLIQKVTGKANQSDAIVVTSADKTVKNASEVDLITVNPPEPEPEAEPEEEFDTKVATKNEDGSIVMKVKTVKKPKTTKATGKKVKKVTKAKTSKSKKK